MADYLLDLEKKRERFRSWYKRNREKYNNERAERYLIDPDYREKARVAAANYRKSRAGSISLEPVNGLFSISQAAALVGRSSQCLRNWEAEGKIPPATRYAGKGKRVYTAAQVGMLKEFVTLKYKTNEIVEAVFKNWSFHERT